MGNEQWQWLENELKSSDAQFNVIVSSIQFLSNKHGFEAWENFPHEIEKLEKLIVSTKAKTTFILSGDRHIATFSSKNILGLSYL